MAFRFTPEHLSFLSSEAAALVDEALREQTEKYSDSLRIQTALRKRFPGMEPHYLRACLELWQLRPRLQHKCGMHPASWCSRDTLEMASSQATARLHANMLPAGGRILDCCSGIGSDAVHLARHNEVLCIEADPVTARMCRHNLRLVHARAAVLAGTAEYWAPALQRGAFDAVFVDPARRDDTRRVYDAEHASPPLSFVQRSFPLLPLLVKTAPAAALSDTSWGRLWVAHQRECKEQLLHRGLDLPLRGVIDATSGVTWSPAGVAPPPPREAQWLIEPGSAVILSGMVAEYLHEQEAWPIDPHIAYGLSAARPTNAPLHQSFRILRMEPYHEGRLRQAVRDLDLGPGTEIKKRGFPRTPDQIRAGLKLSGRNNGVILIARKGDGHVMIFGERDRAPMDESA
ncbi:MAG: RsmD family RNA methyltransferase [Bacteroidia bacterium]|nr:RsmD family RNA methyltransferase [Bacteroidia bacterium]